MEALPPDAVQPPDRATWRKWLVQNHDRSKGVWLVRYKTATGKPRVEYNDAVEEALCFGWIDGQAKTLDTTRSMVWFAPRKPRSVWAKSNKERVERLVAAGLMHPAGLVKVEQAKADGSWSLLDAAENLEIPADLAEALAANPPAAAHFATFPPSVRKMIIGWILLAKRPETRAARVAETARLARENIRVTDERGRRREGR